MAGLNFVQSPPGLRKSAIPESTEIPAPVKTVIRFALAIAWQASSNGSFLSLLLLALIPIFTESLLTFGPRPFPLTPRRFEHVHDHAVILHLTCYPQPHRCAPLQQRTSILGAPSVSLPMSRLVLFFHFEIILKFMDNILAHVTLNVWPQMCGIKKKLKRRSSRDPERERERET